jgi:hypothetical protein
MFDRSIWNETYHVQQETTISNLDSEFLVVVVHDFRDHQRCISDHNSSKNHSITNLKRTLLILLKHEECLTGAYETKRTTCSRTQQFPTWIPSFRSWFVHEIRDHQRCISDHNSPKNHAITKLKRTLLRLLKHKECLTGLYETKPTMCSRKQQFPTWIPSFRSWLNMIFVATNDAYLTITPLKISQLQNWNVRCWDY